LLGLDSRLGPTPHQEFLALFLELAKRLRAQQLHVGTDTHQKNPAQPQQPQAWITLLWHMALRLPWNWRLGPSNASEREHVMDMVKAGGFPSKTLFCGDAGFVGYAFWQALLTAGHHFVIRVGANVRLVRQLGWTREHAQVVYLWPDQAAQKRQPPVVLRLVMVHDGKPPVYLVTDLPKSCLSDCQVATIYGAWWGVEVFFRTFKQTFGCRKLRSRSAQNAQLELEWSLLGLWGVCLLATRELSAGGHEPARLSPAAAIHAFQRLLREYRVRPETPAETLWAQLRRAQLDDYQRHSSKTSRAYPRKKHRTPIGIPQITRATQHQIAQAQALQPQEEFRLSA
jgi:hypothetical protein